MTTKHQRNAQPTAAQTRALTAMLNQHQLDEALVLAQSMTQRYPKHAFAWKALGAIQQAQGAFEAAIVALKQAANLMPHDAEAHYNLANGFYDLQQLSEAALSYQKAIQLAPKFIQAHYNLGSVLRAQGLMVEAEASYQKAMQLAPKNPEMHLNLAQMYHESAQLEKAMAAYTQVIDLQADNASAHMGLGVIYKAQGDLAQAEAYYRKAIALQPEYAEAYSNLGILLKETGRADEAMQAYHTAIHIKPDCAPAYNNLGILHKSLGDLIQAEQCYRQALLVDPNNAVSHNNLGVVLRDQGRFLASEESCKKAIHLRPNYADPYNNLGLALDSQGRFDEAIAAFEQALVCNPQDASILSNFSVTLIMQGQLARAETCLQQALAIAPHLINTYVNLGITYLAQGRTREAEAICKQALAIDPHCVSAKGNLLFAMNYSAQHSIADCFQAAREYNAMVRQATVGQTIVAPYATWQADKAAQRLRVGIVSADMRQHAVAYFLENVVAHLNHHSIELMAYSADAREDEVTARLKPHFAAWKSIVGLDDQAAAKLIHADGVHVLIDLSGHSSGNRLPVFALKPAPVQVSWLGYFATTGLDTMDYFVADEVGVPAETQSQFVEKIEYIPNSRLCFSVPNIDVPVAPLPALRNGFITFGCYQNLAKVGDDVLALWAQVMLALPNAQLRLQSKALGDEQVAQQILARIANVGIAPSRVRMHGFDSREGYFASHAEIDMILDTFPFNGGTTTCEALWMGVPTLTLAGDRLISRQGASLLTAAGLADWVVDTPQAFVATALAFASNTQQLAQLRQNLRAQVAASPLFDGALFAHHFENALWRMSGLTRPQDNTAMPTQISSNPIQKLHHPASDAPLEVLVVSATRSSEQAFWQQSALGLSLLPWLKKEPRMQASIAYENTRGLSQVFNEAIDQAADNTLLVLIHDDVWIDDAQFCESMIAGLQHYDVLGVAGNKRRLPNQPGWAFIDTQFTWDEAQYLSGSVGHGKEAFGFVNHYGAVPAACELMDGVFFAVMKSTLARHQVRFDPQFDFHFYDLDFCRSARLAGLTLGTWPLALTHQSGGAFGSAGWVQKYQQYLDKWEPVTPPNAAFEEAVQAVLDMALAHEQAGDIEQAAQLYQEILNVQPQHALANHNLGMLEAQTQGLAAALPKLALAVKAAPACEQYWVNYIHALMQSGAIQSAVEALELGQQYGLTSNTAQLLAAGFLEEIDGQ